MRVRFSLLIMTCFIIPLFLGGCFWNTHQTPPPDQESISPVLQFMIANMPGATAVLTDPEFGGEVRVTLEETFTSAGGEHCKRATVVSSEQDPEIIVACREKSSAPDAQNGWKLAPRVWGHGLSMD